MNASPGRAYNYIIRGRHTYLGQCDFAMSSAIRDLIDDYRSLRYSSTWLEGTSYSEGVLVIWKKDGTGLVYRDVPPWKVKALHFFALPENIDKLPTHEEMTDQQLHQLLLDSLTQEGD